VRATTLYFALQAMLFNLQYPWCRMVKRNVISNSCLRNSKRCNTC